MTVVVLLWGVHLICTTALVAQRYTRGYRYTKVSII